MATISTWLELLQNEGVPLNSKVDFHCHNEGVRRVVHNGKQISFSRESKAFARDWIFSNRNEAFIVDPLRVDSNGYDWKMAIVIKVSFINGEPGGHPAFGNRKEHKSILNRLTHWRDSKLNAKTVVM